MSRKVFDSNWRGRIFRYAPLILWLGVIFYLSSGQGAMTQTSRFIRPLLEWLFPAAAPETLVVYHGYIRKFAHFFEYGVLAFFGWRAFYNSSSAILQKYWFVWAFSFVVLVAIIDETNQNFNAARTSSIYDVLLDASGGLTVIAVFWFFGRKKKSAAKRRKFLKL